MEQSLLWFAACLALSGLAWGKAENFATYSPRLDNNDYKLNGLLNRTIRSTQENQVNASESDKLLGRRKVKRKITRKTIRRRSHSPEEEINSNNRDESDATEQENSFDENNANQQLQNVINPSEDQATSFRTNNEASDKLADSFVSSRQVQSPENSEEFIPLLQFHHLLGSYAKPQSQVPDLNQYETFHFRHPPQNSLYNSDVINKHHNFMPVVNQPFQESQPSPYLHSPFDGNFGPTQHFAHNPLLPFNGPRLLDHPYEFFHSRVNQDQNQIPAFDLNFPLDARNNYPLKPDGSNENGVHLPVQDPYGVPYSKETPQLNPISSLDWLLPFGAHKHLPYSARSRDVANVPAEVPYDLSNFKESQELPTSSVDLHRPFDLNNQVSTAETSNEVPNVDLYGPFLKKYLALHPDFSRIVSPLDAQNNAPLDSAGSDEAHMSLPVYDPLVDPNDMTRPKGLNLFMGTHTPLVPIHQTFHINSGSHKLSPSNLVPQEYLSNPFNFHNRPFRYEYKPSHSEKSYGIDDLINEIIQYIINNSNTTTAKPNITTPKPTTPQPTITHPIITTPHPIITRPHPTKPQTTTNTLRPTTPRPKPDNSCVDLNIKLQKLYQALYPYLDPHTPQPKVENIRSLLDIIQLYLHLNSHYDFSRMTEQWVLYTLYCYSYRKLDPTYRCYDNPSPPYYPTFTKPSYPTYRPPYYPTHEQPYPTYNQVYHSGNVSPTNDLIDGLVIDDPNRPLNHYSENDSPVNDPINGWMIKDAINPRNQSPANDTPKPDQTEVPPKTLEVLVDFFAHIGLLPNFQSILPDDLLKKCKNMAARRFLLRLQAAVEEYTKSFRVCASYFYVGNPVRDRNPKPSSIKGFSYDYMDNLYDDGKDILTGKLKNM